jgi:hypothetical protein
MRLRGIAGGGSKTVPLYAGLLLRLNHPRGSDTGTRWQVLLRCFHHPRRWQRRCIESDPCLSDESARGSSGTFAIGIVDQDLRQLYSTARLG